jgi:hypothetical protein
MAPYQQSLKQWPLIPAVILLIFVAACLAAWPQRAQAQEGYPIVDTGQTGCYDDQAAMACPAAGATYYGQDSQYNGLQPSYQDNGDGTVTDLNTGLMWQQTPDLENKSTYAEAVAGASTLNLAGYTDWRLPTIKELYSLTNFNGTITTHTPFLDTDYFDFAYGDESAGEREIDAQYWSSTEYLGLVFTNQQAVFGMNFADGRIKGYPRNTMTQFVRYVRGSTSYGVNSFTDNGDQTISDAATDLMWQKGDSGSEMIWADALAYCENLTQAGHDDWRLPNTKELHSIVDYDFAPDATSTAQQGPAIDLTVFDLTETESWFWTSTTLLEDPGEGVYIAFGQAFGIYSGEQINVHGAGAQRSDPKSGDPADYPDGRGPQNDEIRIYNYVRCVRDDDTTPPVDDVTPPTFAATPLITPTGSVLLTDKTPTFDWDDATDDVSTTLTYTLLVTNSGGANVQNTTTTASTFTPASDLAEGEYTWTVRAQDAAGNLSPYVTPVESFTITSTTSIVYDYQVYIPLIRK